MDICKRNGKNKLLWLSDRDKTLAYEPKSGEMVLTVHRWFANKLTLRLLMDKESIELFVNGGERVVTSLIPTPLEADGITFAADAPIDLSVEAHHLK